MAEADRIKISRKELREPDEFQALTAQVAAWLRANQSAVVGGASALVAVAAIILGVSWYGGRRSEAAAVRLGSAQALFQATKYAEAATEFQSINAEYGRTPAGRLAGLYRGHALLRQPDAAAAATAYGEYLASSPPTQYLRQEGLIGLGRAEEAADDRAAALDAYRQAGESAGPFRTEALVAAARLEEASGNADKSRALYVELLKTPDLDADTRALIVGKVPAAERPPEPSTSPDTHAE